MSTGNQGTDTRSRKGSVIPNKQRYVSLFKPSSDELRFARTMREHWGGWQWPSLVDDVIKTIQLDLSRGQVDTKENLIIMFQNDATLCHTSKSHLKDAIKEAIKMMEQGYGSLTEYQVVNGLFKSDPHWTGD